jgi:AcrR family transcriptional regulator
MTEKSSRATVVDAARRLFGERGYKSVTIRDVAAEAGLSPAMVMKVVGSKAKLYADAAPMDPEPYNPQVPPALVGYELVRRVLQRRDAEASEPWARAIYLTRDAPDPETARRAFRERFLGSIKPHLGDGPEAQVRTELVVCALVGLACGVRTFRLLPAGEHDPEDLVQRYGALVQSLIDG